MNQAGDEGGAADGEEEQEEEAVRLKWVGHIIGLSLVPPPGAVTTGVKS